MKWRKIVVILSLAVLLGIPLGTRAQSQEAQQLILDVIKLAQLKKILNELYQGYQIVSKGYGTIQDISQGNFSLHKTFLDGLLAVSPGVAKYKRVADIVQYQLSLVKEYKSAFSYFKQSGHFTAEEIDYIGGVYNSLFSRSLQNLDALFMVITAGKLRMSDDERLSAIDKIFSGMEDQLSFLRSFNNQAKLLALQRKGEQHDVNSSRELYDLK